MRVANLRPCRVHTPTGGGALRPLPLLMTPGHSAPSLRAPLVIHELQPSQSELPTPEDRSQQQLA